MTLVPPKYPSTETQILTMPSLSPGIMDEYIEIGELLSEMVGFEEDDELRIDKPVYEAACQIAAQLMVRGKIIQHPASSTTDQSQLFLIGQKGLTIYILL